MIKKLLLLSSIWIFAICQSQAQEVVLTLEVLSKETGLPLEDAQIAIDPCACGGITDRDGKLSILLPIGEYMVRTYYIGFREDVRKINLIKAISLKLQLQEEQEELSEVVVRAKRRLDNVESPQMGALNLEVQVLKKIPAALGEFDVLRGMTLLAGVNNAGEVSNGLSVRGGSLDQNLMLYDYAPVFNPTHLFGLLSVFTPDMVSSVELYRANIPARYGGRNTSVMDVKVRNPYVDKVKLSGGIGLISSRLTLETPLIKDKLMLSVGGRAGLIGLILPHISERLKDTKANFYDGTLKLLYLPTDRDQVSFTGFVSKDFYQLDLISKVENINAKYNQYDLFNLNGTLNWMHSFKDESNLRTIFVTSSYAPKMIFPEEDNDNEIKYRSDLGYLSFISEYSKDINENLGYYAGGQVNRYKIQPGELDPGSGNSILPKQIESETSYEFSAFGNINWNPTEKLMLSGGLRFNHYVFVGPYNQATFDDLTGDLLNIYRFEKGDGVKTYNGLEPRLGATYKLGENTSIKASYARLNQYLQNVYNSSTPLPTSRWKTSDSNIEPQSSDTFGFGVYADLNDEAIEVGLEGYYRDTRNNLAYKPGADFFLAEYLERDVIQTKGKAYGAELSFKKPRGKVNGWFNYTWSRSLLRSNEEKLANRINNNEWYPSDFDRPHVFNGTINYEGDKYNTWSFNFTAQTGRPLTIANGVFPLDDIDVPVFLNRNNSRLRPYHRLDFSWKIKYAKNPNRKWVGDWTFTIYNLYSRRNPLNSYYTQRFQGTADGDVFLGSPLGTYELSVMNSPLVSITYNFVFD